MLGAFGGIRTPNLLIRSQMLYPLSYERNMSDSVPAGSQDTDGLCGGEGGI